MEYTRKYHSVSELKMFESNQGDWLNRYVLKKKTEVPANVQLAFDAGSSFGYIVQTTLARDLGVEVDSSDWPNPNPEKGQFAMDVFVKCGMYAELLSRCKRAVSVDFEVKIEGRLPGVDLPILGYADIVLYKDKAKKKCDVYDFKTKSIGNPDKFKSPTSAYDEFWLTDGTFKFSRVCDGFMTKHYDLQLETYSTLLNEHIETGRHRGFILEINPLGTSIFSGVCASDCIGRFKVLSDHVRSGELLTEGQQLALDIGLL